MISSGNVQFLSPEFLDRLRKDPKRVSFKKFEIIVEVEIKWRWKTVLLTLSSIGNGFLCFGIQITTDIFPPIVIFSPITPDIKMTASVISHKAIPDEKIFFRGWKFQSKTGFDLFFLFQSNFGIFWFWFIVEVTKWPFCDFLTYYQKFEFSIFSVIWKADLYGVIWEFWNKFFRSHGFCFFKIWDRFQFSTGTYQTIFFKAFPM